MRRTRNRSVSNKLLSGALPVEKYTKSPLTAVVYGRSGTGKTTFAATFPKPLLLLDIEDRGTDSISDVPEVDVLRISKFSELMDLYLELPESKYKTVVWDTISQAQQLLIREYTGADKSTDLKARRMLSQRDWGGISSMLKEVSMLYRNLPMNILFLAQTRTVEMETNDEEDIEPEIGPDLSPSISRALCANVNMIGNTSIKEIKARDPKTKKIVITKDYYLGVGPSSIYTRKIRKPRGIKIPGDIRDPTYDKIISLTSMTRTSRKERKNKA